MPPAAAEVSVPGFADHHAHLLRASAGIGFPATTDAVRDFHRQVAAQGRSPMDVPDPPDALGLPGLAGRLMTGLVKAAAAGLVEVTEMGMHSWAYLDALTAMQASRALPLRVRIYLASGLAEEASRAELDSRRADCGPWTRLDGVKFYADGWLVPRTCALCQDFADAGGRGLLFTGHEALARRIAPLTDRGWRIAVHAIGDRAVQAVLDGYELAWAGDRAAITAAAPRIEHASVLSAELVARIAETGVIACIQPSFALTDAAQIGPALGADRVARAYPWTELAAAGADMRAGSDYPIEVLDPLPSLARLVCGRSGRPGFTTAGEAPRQARLPVTTAFGLMTDPAAGRTRLSADPRTVTDSQIDAIEVLGTQPEPF
jgi:predicted amidohydrolase YtcJ